MTNNTFCTCFLNSSMVELNYAATRENSTVFVGNEVGFTQM